MKIEQLKNDRTYDFINYCKKHRNEVAAGRLEGPDLDVFKPNDENPTYIAVNEKNQIVGAVSLVIEDYNKAVKNSPFRIFHSTITDKKIYEIMFNKIKLHTQGLEYLITHIKENDGKTAEILKELGFELDGYSYNMIREDMAVNPPCFPEGFELKTFQIGRDEDDWCFIRNIGFGKEGLLSPDDIHIFYDDTAYMDGGMKILYHNKMPVGTIRTVKEYENEMPYAYIGSVCVKPEYRGMGLARNMLRAAIQFGKDNGLQKTLLEVDVKNKNALTLYTNEGFIKAYGLVEYHYYLNR